MTPEEQTIGMLRAIMDDPEYLGNVETRRRTQVVVLAALASTRNAALEEAALEAFNVIQLSGGGGVAVGILVADRIRALKAR